MEFEYRDGVYETKQRVYSENGKSPTLTAGNSEQYIETHDTPKKINPSKKEYISKESVEKYVEDVNAEFNDPYNKKTIKGDKSTTLRTNSSNGNMWVNEKAIKETHDTPKQVGTAVADIPRGVGSSIVTEIVSKQALESVTNTSYEPAIKVSKS
jgi:hypothetical protein